jgi:predicted nuclease with TOPRIM domain
LSQLTDLDLKKEIGDMREQIDDHLQSINENTDEIENNYSYLVDIDQRLKLLETKVDSIFDMLAKLTKTDVKKTRSKIKLSEQEQVVFSVLYMADRALDYGQLCFKSKRSEYFVRNCINTMIEKGIPIKKHIINKKVYFILDKAFKDLQTKKNILNIEKTLTLDCFDQNVLH